MSSGRRRRRSPGRPATYCFELAAGDVLFGSLIGVDDRKAELNIPRLGRLHVERTNLHRIYRWRDGADLIYLGPNGLVGWREPATQNNWHEESGQPTTDREGASIRGDFGLPARAIIEFEISWKTKPDFVFALGVDDKDATVKRAFRFEAWGGDLVVQRELEQEADLAVVQEVKTGPGRTHLQAYLDQQEGRILVFSPSGAQLADLKVVGNKPAAQPGLYLANIRGDVRLEWLRIGRWNGEIPREARNDHGPDPPGRRLDLLRLPDGLSSPIRRSSSSRPTRASRRSRRARSAASSSRSPRTSPRG